VLLLGLAQDLLGDQEHAEDVVQDVLLQAWSSFRPGCNLSKLVGQLRQLVLEHCQRELRGVDGDQVEYAGVHLPLVASVGGAFDELGELPLEQELIALAMQSLPVRLRRPLDLRYLQGLSRAETGRTLGVSDRVLSTRLAAAIRALRRTVHALLVEGVQVSARLAS